MARRSTAIGLVGVFIVGLGVTTPGGGGSAALAQEAGRGEKTRDPRQHPDNLRLRELAEPGLRWGARSEQDIVPPEKREAMGLDDISWTKQYGKVHPDVYKALEKAEIRRDPWEDIQGYAGTVYVQVHLKHEPRGRPKSEENQAAIKQLQGKVLSTLTAAEFYTHYTFRSLPGILGRVNRAGLDKLSGAADVIAVSLDDRPFPQPPKAVTRLDLPPVTAGDPCIQPAQGRFWGSGGNVEADVYRALALHERVFVLVIMNDGQVNDQLARNSGKGRAIEEPLLASLTASDFWLCSRAPIGSEHSLFLDGLVNLDGLKKLDGNPLVKAVGLDGPPIPVPKLQKAPREAAHTPAKKDGPQSEEEP